MDTPKWSCFKSTIAILKVNKEDPEENDLDKAISIVAKAIKKDCGHIEYDNFRYT